MSPKKAKKKNIWKVPKNPHLDTDGTMHCQCDSIKEGEDMLNVYHKCFCGGAQVKKLYAEADKFKDKDTYSG